MRDESQRWQQILAAGFSTVAELLTFLEIPIESGSTSAERSFATRVPRGFAARMEKGNPFDPLLLQVLPQEEELRGAAGFVQDPLMERKTNTMKGLIHKYHGRVLLTLTGVCAVHCRYCFRRHFPYQDNNPGREGWLDVLNYIRKDNTIQEVILSGGDPLLATDATFDFLMSELESIPHVTILRIHSRVPVVLPERVTDVFCKRLERSRLRVVVVLHANHPRELNDVVSECCQRLRAYGCHLLNQSVLLKNVNDEVNVLVQLSQRLFECGVMPYYLHVLDKVEGAVHFDLNEARAKELHESMSERLPGYLVPRLVRELPDAPRKVPV